MAATEAQIRANQQNAKKSTGPKTVEGKEKSRANALKHGLSGAGVVLPEREAAEVLRRYQTYGAELKAVGEVSSALALRVATMAVRMEVCTRLQTNSVSAAVRQAIHDCEVPEGADDAEIRRLLIQASDQVVLTPPKEIIALRKYESAAERGFYRALKELRQYQKAVKAEQAEQEASSSQTMEQLLASFEEDEAIDADLDEMERKHGLPPMMMPSRPSIPADLEAMKARVDVPMTIGKRR